VPNKVTQEGRELFRLAFEELSGDFQGWIRSAAQEDPGKAAALVLSLAEFAIPKLARQVTTLVDATDEELLAEVKRRTEQGPDAG
jgi:hypothetical protein